MKSDRQRYFKINTWNQTKITFEAPYEKLDILQCVQLSGSVLMQCQKCEHTKNQCDRTFRWRILSRLITKNKTERKNKSQTLLRYWISCLRNHKTQWNTNRPSRNSHWGIALLERENRKHCLLKNIKPIRYRLHRLGSKTIKANRTVLNIPYYVINKHTYADFNKARRCSVQ